MASTQRTLPRLAICDGFACAGGVILARAGGRDNAPTNFTDTRSEDNAERLTFSLPGASPAAVAVQERRIARVMYEDESFDEWVIATVKLTRDGATSRMDVTCAAPIECLTDCGDVEADIATQDGTPMLADGVAQTTLTDLFQGKLVDNTKLAAVLPFTLAVGDIDPTIAIDLDWSDASAAAVINAAVSEAQARDQLAYVWDLVKNGTASYDIIVKAA